MVIHQASENTLAVTVPIGVMWVITLASARNNTRSGEYHISINRLGSAADSVRNETSVAIGTNATVSCLEDTQIPLVVNGGDLVGIVNSNFVAGDLNTFYLRYVEVISG